MSTTGSCPLQTPANTLVGVAAQAQTNLDELNGHWGFRGLFSCLLPPWPAWAVHAEAQKILDQTTADSCNENYEIALECIEIDFNTGYVGGGNTSSVFRGTWNGRRIALKKLNRNQTSAGDIRKLISLDHPNVVRTLGVCTKDMYPCIISDFCEKGSLFDYLPKHPLSKAEFIRFCREVATGMQYLHSQKIVHRDLKSPNILIDGNDSLKICDFGSIFAMENTHMASAKMSMVGTSSWISPELIKNEACTEKVDVWSYGVVAWELCTQEIPFKGLNSMSILFGVGSGNLRLHVPKSAPHSYTLLLKLCFAQRPRNRPSFSSILKHLANLAVEIDSISEDAWSMRREVWKKEVGEKNQTEKLPNGNGNSNEDAKQLNQQKAAELINKRIHELRHAQELAQMYKTKIRRAERLNDELSKFLQVLSLREAAIAEQEAQMRRAGTVGPSNGHSPPVVHKHTSGSVPELKAVRLQKAVVARSSGRGNKTVTAVYPAGGHRAVLTMEVEDDNEGGDEKDLESDSESEHSTYGAHLEAPLPNTPAASTPNLQHRRIAAVCSLSSSDDERFSAIPPRSRHSYAAFSRQESFEDGRGFSSTSRAASARSSIAHRHHSGIRNASATYLPAADDEYPMVCPCCSYSFAFQRSSAARVSGISADSGVVSAGTDGRHHSALMLDVEENGNTTNGLSADVHLYRNHQARWSDGRIAHRHHTHRHSSTAPNSATRQRTAPLRRSAAFTRDSPARVPSTKRHRTASMSRHPVASQNSVDSVQEPSSCQDSARIHRSHSVHSRPEVHSAPTDPTVEEADVPMQMDTSMEISARYPRRTVDETIAELSSSVSSKSNRSPKKAPLLGGIGMEQSSSTMASSLERSLEAALIDGLSDKESKLQAVKSSFRTHRRCASNPTCILDQSKCVARAIAETSTESDQEPVQR